MLSKLCKESVYGQLSVKNRAAALMCALWLISVGAHAKDLAEALSAVQLDETSCLEAESQEATKLSWPKGATPKALEGDCWINSQELLQQGWGHNSERASYLVDVRAPSQRRKRVIPAALEIALHELPNKRFLHAAEIVLIGTGLDNADLTRTCQTLSRAGFKDVRALRGGAKAWLQASNGETNDSVTVVALSTSELLASLQQDVAWLLVIDASIPESEHGMLPLAPAKMISAKTLRNTQALVQQLKQLGQQAHGEEKVLLLAQEPLRAESLQAVAQEMDKRKKVTKAPKRDAVLVYVLQDSWPQYQRHVQQSHAIRLTAKQALRAPCARL